MPLHWNLKKWLAMERNIYRPSELQTLLAEQEGVYLSLQTISALMNGKPSAIRVQTIQALCNVLDCKLSDFCDIVPQSARERAKQRKVAGDTPRHLYGAKGQTTTPPRQAGPERFFPDADDFVHPKDAEEQGEER